MSVLPRPRTVDVVLFFAAISWGSTYLMTKTLVRDPSDTPVVVATRMLGSAAVLALVALVTRRGRPTAAEWRTGALLGLTLSAVFALETYGIALTSATNAGVLVSLCIVFTPFAESAVRRTRLRGSLVLLCLAAVVGAGLLAGGNGFTAPHLGDLLILGAALARVVHVTTSGAVQARLPLDPYRLTAIQLGTVGLVFAVVCPIAGAPVSSFFAHLTGSDLAVLLYLAVIAGALGFVVQTWGIAKTSATHAGLLLGTEPVWAALFGVVVAGDRLGVVGIVGITVTLAAVLAAQRLSARESGSREALSDTRSRPPDRSSPAYRRAPTLGSPAGRLDGRRPAPTAQVADHGSDHRRPPGRLTWASESRWTGSGPATRDRYPSDR